MKQTAKVSRIAIGVFLANATLVLGVAAFRPVGAQDPLGQSNIAPDIELPPKAPIDNPPSFGALPPPVVESGVPTAKGSANQTGNNMVLDEILKAIRDNPQELDVPPLSFPPLAGLSTGTSPTVGDALSWQSTQLRLESLSSLVATSQSLVKEAKLLHQSGQAAQAKSLMQQVQTLRLLISSLAKDQLP
ncbi:MAG: hypothetical protein IT423_14275 [Pirellulaceae bacterium]|nr:hypothetical protein [Pirellulaceae bacterium]